MQHGGTHRLCKACSHTHRARHLHHPALTCATLLSTTSPSPPILSGMSEAVDAPADGEASAGQLSKQVQHMHGEQDAVWMARGQKGVEGPLSTRAEGMTHLITPYPPTSPKQPTCCA